MAILPAHCEALHKAGSAGKIAGSEALIIRVSAR
jgi:hypothetical protein